MAVKLKKGIFIHPERSKGGVLKFCIGICLRMLNVPCLYVTSFSSHTSGLKIGMYISHMEGFKVTVQIFYTLPEAEIFKITVLYLRL